MGEQERLPWHMRRGGQDGIREYDENPFIACLPPTPSDRDVFKHLLCKPECKDAERALPSHLRQQLVFVRMKQAFFPTGQQLRQAQQIDLLIRGGYCARNPSTGTWQAGMTELAIGGPEGMAAGMAERRRLSDMAADSMATLGPSGIGKTTVLRRTLDAYPQVVEHIGQQGETFTQIVWIRVEAPSDGSTKQTVLSIFAAIDGLLGTNFVEKHGKLPREQLLIKAQQICTRYAIGIIAVDEIQNLQNSRSGFADLMSFLTSIVNVVNVPILMIGTMKAVDMFKETFRTARRAEGVGSLVYEPLENSEEWKSFANTLFSFQWTAERTELTPEIADTLWNESQGIIDIAVKLFVLSQMRAIRLGERGQPEIITAGLIEATARDSLKMVQPMLDALRRKDWKALARFEDIASLDMAIAAELQRDWPGAAQSPDLDALAASIASRIEGPSGEVADSLMSAALIASGLGEAEIAAIMEIVASKRPPAGPNQSSSQDGRQNATQNVRPIRRKQATVHSQPTDPSDVRLAASSDDPLAKLQAAGLVDAR